MAKKPSKSQSSAARSARAECESVHFAEVDFPRPVEPRLVVQFSDGLSLLVEDRTAVDLAAEFIAAFRSFENRIHDEGGAR